VAFVLRASKWLSEYQTAWLKSDAIAGVTLVGLTPQLSTL
jgi:hypothetical protein